MSNKLFIQGGGQTKAYECKSTHTGSPYLKVSSGYLDLTTNTTSGIQLKIKNGNQTYRPLQSYSTTSNRSSQYTSTSGYSGSLSRASTSGYSGVSSQSSTYTSTTRIGFYSATSSTTFTSLGTYYGEISSYRSVTTSTISRVGYRCSIRTEYYKSTKSSTSTHNHTYNTCIDVHYSLSSRAYNIYTRSYKPYFTKSGTSETLLVYGYYGAISGSNYVYNSRSSDVRIFSDTAMGSTSGALYYNHSSLSAKFKGIARTTSVIRTKSSIYFIYTQDWETETIYNISGNSYSVSWITSSDSKITSTSNSNWRGIRYYTNTYTRQSTYRTSSNITNAGISSTTALTRSSAYATSSTIVGSLSNTTALTRTSSRTSSYSSTTEL